LREGRWQDAAGKKSGRGEAGKKRGSGAAAATSNHAEETVPFGWVGRQSAVARRRFFITEGITPFARALFP